MTRGRYYLVAVLAVAVLLAAFAALRTWLPNAGRVTEVEPAAVDGGDDQPKQPLDQPPRLPVEMDPSGVTEPVVKQEFAYPKALLENGPRGVGLRQVFVTSSRGKNYILGTNAETPPTMPLPGTLTDLRESSQGFAIASRDGAVFCGHDGSVRKRFDGVTSRLWTLTLLLTLDYDVVGVAKWGAKRTDKAIITILTDELEPRWIVTFPRRTPPGVLDPEAPLLLYAPRPPGHLPEGMSEQIEVWEGDRLLQSFGERYPGVRMLAASPAGRLYLLVPQEEAREVVAVQWRGQRLWSLKVPEGVGAVGGVGCWPLVDGRRKTESTLLEYHTEVYYKPRGRRVYLPEAVLVSPEGKVVKRFPETHCPSVELLSRDSQLMVLTTVLDGSHVCIEVATGKTVWQRSQQDFWLTDVPGVRRGLKNVQFGSVDGFATLTVTEAAGPDGSPGKTTFLIRKFADCSEVYREELPGVDWRLYAARGGQTLWLLSGEGRLIRYTSPDVTSADDAATDRTGQDRQPPGG